MSLLNFGRFFRSTSRDGSNGRGEGNGGDDVVATRIESFRLDDDDSSFGLPSDASLSDHEVVIGFPPGTLLDIYNDRHRHQEEQEDGSFGATILSSVPSVDVQLPPTCREQQQRAIGDHVLSAEPGFHVESIQLQLDARHPFNVENALSISTTVTEYRNLQSMQSSVVSISEDDSAMSASLSACNLSFSTLDVSTIPSSVTSSVEGQNTECALVVHDGAAFRNIADRLALQRQNSGDWFSHFTEQDWKEFRIAANTILHALQPTQQQSSPILPHPPPLPTMFATTNAMEQVVSTPIEYDLRSHLPQSFLCYLCLDVIVGATTLDCACDRSSLCAECWESYSTRVVDSEDCGYLLLTTQTTCPSCNGAAHSAVPCPALDTAIVYVMMSIPEPLQRIYYYRLDRWRKVVLRRMRENGENSSTVALRSSSRHDLILAELIHQEEECFWNENSRERTHQIFVRPQQALVFVAEMAACIAVASLSAVGLTALAAASRRR